MTSVSLTEAQAKLPQLLHGLTPGEELVITEGDRPLATITAAAPSMPRRLGTLANSVQSIAEDFDAPLKDFEDYTE